MHPSMQRIWEPDEVIAELRAALDVVDQLDPAEDLRLSVFSTAVQLLTQRAIRQSVGGIALPQG